MTLRSDLRGDFPPGWWRSGAWWRAGALELATQIAIVACTVLLVRRVWTGLRLRDSPWALRRLDEHFDGYGTAALVNIGGISMVVGVSWFGAQDAPFPVSLTWAAAAVLAVNVATALAAVIVVLRSRRRAPAAWESIDFVGRHHPKAGQHPETVEAYRAARLLVEAGASRRT